MTDLEMAAYIRELTKSWQHGKEWEPTAEWRAAQKRRERQQRPRQQQPSAPTQQRPQQAQQPSTVYADGREATAEQKARLRELRCAKSGDGYDIFTNEEISAWLLSYAKEKTAQQFIEFIENVLRNRRADAPELP